MDVTWFLLARILYIFVAFAIFPETSASDSSKRVFSNRCSNRLSENIFYENANKIIIPASLLRNENQNTMTITLRHKKPPLNCNQSSAIKQTVYWDNDTKSTIQIATRRNFVTLEGASHKTPVHFLNDGTFFNGTHYFQSDGDYCIDNFNLSSATLYTCSQNTTEYVQIPKCCAYDEVSDVDSKCQKLYQNETLWQPELYIVNPNGGRPHFINYSSTQKISMFTEDLYSKCQHAKPPPGYFFRYWSPTGMGSDVKHSVKLVVTTTPAGTKQLVPFVFYVGIRKWVPKPDTQFCVDGTFILDGTFPNETEIYTGHPNDFVIYWCETNPPVRHPYPKFKSWVYGTTSLISSLFLLATVVIYLLLLKHHKLPGLTVLMYSIAMLFKYILATSSHFVIVFPNDHITGIESGGYKLCFWIAVTRHYFYFASLFWMTIMNIKFVRTFRKTEIIARNTKHTKTLLLFCLFAWGIPLVLVVTFCIIELVYQDPLSEVPVPQYADRVCYVGRGFRGYYIYTPMAIILAANLPMVLITVRIFWRAKMDRRRNLEGGESRKSAQAGEYTAAFFLKLFVIMGGTDLLEFLTWYYHEPERNGFKPYWVVAVEAVNNLLTPVLLFGMFCLNKRIRKQLKERFS